MPLDIQFTDNMMETYIVAFKSPINAVVKRHLNRLDPDELSEKEDLFQVWVKAQDKQTVAHCYKDSGWRALYARILYKSRIMTVLYTFQHLQKRLPSLTSSLKSVSSIVSIGCGPGPEIAAVLMALRVCVAVDHSLEVLGVDQYNEWSEYVTSLSSVNIQGHRTKVEFQTLLVDYNTVSRITSADLCIMSYTDATMHTSTFWRQLKKLFRLIVILDQRNPKLARTLLYEQYEMVEYEYKGEKRFFYWMSPQGIHLRTSDSKDFSTQSTSTKYRAPAPPTVSTHIPTNQNLKSILKTTEYTSTTRSPQPIASTYAPSTQYPQSIDRPRVHSSTTRSPQSIASTYAPSTQYREPSLPDYITTPTSSYIRQPPISTISPISHQPSRQQTRQPSAEYTPPRRQQQRWDPEICNEELYKEPSKPCCCCCS